MNVIVEKIVKGEDLLLAAKRQIAGAGKWCKGFMGSVNGPKCAIGALQYVFTGNPTEKDGDGQTALESILASCVPKRYHSKTDRNAIVMFNDDSKTTKKDVLKLFNRAIEKAKKIK